MEAMVHTQIIDHFPPNLQEQTDRYYFISKCPQMDILL